MLKIEKLRVLSLPPLSFEVEGGACLAIEGPSGSGKSRLLRAIADLDPADGSVWLDEAERHDYRPSDWRRLVRFVPAEAGWWHATALEHFSSAGAARNLARQFGVAEGRLGAEIGTLSTGERQRLAFARALEDDPAVLLLDEPTAALDAAATALVEAEIERRLAAGAVVLIASHDEAQIERLSDARLQLAAPASTAASADTQVST